MLGAGLIVLPRSPNLPGHLQPVPQRNAVGNTRDHAIPIFGALWREQTEIVGWSLRLYSAPTQPAPATIEAIQQPDRPAQRSREVYHRRIDADHQIKRGHQRRGVGEVQQVVDEVVQPQRR